MTRIAKVIATVAYAGYAPVAPGTVGSAVAAVVYWALPELHPITGVPVCLFLLVVGVWASSRAEHVYGRDASRIVIDEFTGFFIAVLLLPKTLAIIILGFFIFRFFDIFKPFPIRHAEKIKGGVGVMGDDVLAGICTNILLRLYLWIVH